MTKVRAAIFVLALAQAGVTRADILTLRSGNAPRGSADPDIRCTYAVGSCPLSASGFTPADFASACAGTQAVVITPNPAWIAGLSTDPLAQWIGVDPFSTGAATLYCQHFTIDSIPSCAARIDMTFAGDDQLGDGFPDSCGSPAPPNPVGAYLNGQAVVVAGSWPPTGFTWETSLTIPDARPWLVRGDNVLSFYHRDMYGSPSGALYTMTLVIEPDGDGDGIGDACDNCPQPNPPHPAPTDCNGDGDVVDPGEGVDEQCDADLDGMGDACDCLPLNPLNPPLEALSLIQVRKAASPAVRISWPPVADAVGYECYRGFVDPGMRFRDCLSTLQCFASPPITSDHVDDLLERPRSLFFYLVSTWCTGEESSLGQDSLGRERWPPPFVRPACPELFRDSDGDGVQDAEDACPETPDSIQGDADGDAIGDACDSCPLAFDSYNRDRDADGIGDACDCDVDGDLVDNAGRDDAGLDCRPVLLDNCRDVPNPAQDDADADGAGDPCDDCPARANADQLDTDHDGCGDACDPMPRDPQTGC
jgi:hypothetical protein